MKKIILLVIFLFGTISFSLTEEQKIDKLISHVENMDSQFYRNGKYYSGKKAASHLRRKYNHTKDRVKTARQFVIYLASESSITKKPYKIKFSNGKEVYAKDYLLKELDKLE